MVHRCAVPPGAQIAPVRTTPAVLVFHRGCSRPEPTGVGQQYMFMMRASLAAALLCFTTAVQAAPPHPLDPLSASELLDIRATLDRSGQFSAFTNFVWIQLQEPPKQTVE